MISIAIGAVLYLFVVRRVFLRKNADGTDRYVDLWPKKLDLEDLLYRPLLQTILPFAGVFVCRICDSLVDGLIVFLRKTIYKDRKIPFLEPDGFRMWALSSERCSTGRPHAVADEAKIRFTASECGISNGWRTRVLA
ncbi:MAG: hypothetical protein V8R80_01765 [Eubacterium sp.]